MSLQDAHHQAVELSSIGVPVTGSPLPPVAYFPANSSGQPLFLSHGVTPGGPINAYAAIPMTFNGESLQDTSSATKYQSDSSLSAKSNTPLLSGADISASGPFSVDSTVVKKFPIYITFIQMMLLVVSVILVAIFRFPSYGRIYFAFILGCGPMALAQCFISRRDSKLISLLFGALHLGFASQPIVWGFLQAGTLAFQLGVDYAIFYFILQAIWFVFMRWFYLTLKKQNSPA